MSVCSDPAFDILTVEELSAKAQEAVDALEEFLRDDLEIFSSGEQESQDEVADEAAAEVEEATGGAVSSEQYRENNSSPSTTSETASPFEKIYEETKAELLNVAKNNLNAFTQQSIKYSITLIDDLDVVLDQISNECLRISVAYGAGLLIPPDRREVEDLKNDVQNVKDQTDAAVIELNSAVIRRQVARDAALKDSSSFSEIDLETVEGRYIVPQEGSAVVNQSPPAPVNLNLSSASENDQGLSEAGERRARLSDNLPDATTVLQGSVIQKVTYIALCAAIDGLRNSEQDAAEAAYIFGKLKGVVDVIMESIGSGFANTVKGLLQEASINQIQNVGNEIQKRLDAFDRYLASTLPGLPSFVRVVNSIGDRPLDLPSLDSIAAECGLTKSSFCEMQGLLEIAKTLDNEIGIVKDRAPAFARVQLVLQAPAAKDIRPPAVLPDSEANMILVGALEGETRVDYVGPNATHVIARFPRANIRSELSAPVPPVLGSAAQDAAIGDQELVITPDVGNVYNFATLGKITLYPGASQEVVRYSSFTEEGGNFRFTLIDPIPVVVTGPPSATTVQVTGEQRNTFQGAFEPNRAIKGGPGRLALAGDGETRQQLDYESSSFDASNGEYTFVIDTDATPLSPSAPEHRFQLLCRPHQKKKTILYKDTSLGSILQTGRRFKVFADGRIYALERESPFNIDATFDWSANGTNVIDDINDYASGVGQYRLLVGTDNTPYALQEFDSDGLGNYVRLEWPYALGDQERVTLSRVDAEQAPGQSTVRLKLDRRQQDDIRVRDLAEGATADISGRVVVDGGGATTMVGGFSEEITSTATPTPRQTITSKAPIVRGDEADMPNGGARIEVLSGRSYFSSRIIDTDAANKQVTFELPQGPGTVSIAAVGNTRAGYYTSGDLVLLQGSSTQFLSDFQIADYVYVDGAPRRILEVRNNLEIIVTSPFPSVDSGLDYHKCAPDGPTAVGANGQSFTIQRQPREDLEFTAITRVDDGVPGSPEPTSPFFDLTLSSPTQFAHGLQEPEVPATVKIIPQDEFTAFRDSFSDPADSVTPRFDGTIIPPGTTTLRAVFQEPAQESIFSDLVLQASKIILPDALKTEISVGPTDTVIDPETSEYVFDIADNPLVFPLEDGDVIEVETGSSVFDFLEDLFPGEWNNDFDEFLVSLLDKITLMNSKVCRILNGRPMDMAVTALAAVAAIETFRFGFLLNLKLTLQALVLALQPSEVIEATLADYKKNGMDAAYNNLLSGDIKAIAATTYKAATSAGCALQALDEYRQVVTEPSKIKALDNIKAKINGLQRDTEILVGARRPYKEIAKDKISQQQEAAEALSEDTEVATS